jgi:hypothetical protein
MVRLASCEQSYRLMDGSVHVPMRWFELAREHWTVRYRSTGTPCSCPLCRGEEYDRKAYKRETRRMISESEEYMLDDPTFMTCNF